MDITQALKDAENSLRDFIGHTLSSNMGKHWLSEIGVTQKRIDNWNSRKITEEKRQTSGAVEERILYYADFYDLKTILKHHWGTYFSKVFGDWKTMEVFLTEMEKLRDPDAHRRELLPHQKALAIGISGEIRTKIVRFRSQLEKIEDHFPRLESIRDSLGTMHIPQAQKKGMITSTNLTLRVGDSVDIVATATDPLGEELSFLFKTLHGSQDTGWQKSNSFSITFSEKDIRAMCDISIRIRSPRPHHASGDYDDYVTLRYTVLPAR